MGEIDYKQSTLFTAIKGVRHGFFTKNGGVSSGVYTSLNCSPSSDDKPENVIENRQRVMSVLGMEQAQLFGLHQIHSKHVHQINSVNDTNFPDGDALVTTQQGIALSVLGADCTPVLFASKTGSVIGAAHAGWRGAVIGIVETVVKKMVELGERREDIIACIGPTIHQPFYEVQDDFITQLETMSDFAVNDFLLEKEGGVYFDLPAYLQEQCQRSDIKSESLGLDTYALEDEFFSYRRNTHRDLNDYGRQISVIGLE
ncbi:MAG: peptidoglycan editing factor PgeF [Cocleimonas sp.]